ncbi:FG-GAP-like repeat-containing protein [Streptomyces sp. SP18CS02]|uniref:FG-GAP-like repeat-containing protein n=1 Tax=Streptomyces sp. SP18CS02 TaxID=3002531 RepID=UPI002E7A0808|nr:FG-GAP-like repeat-containing protein [Streptomyces sp. SP18CS02]MEE1751214.1 FG-GAP-like repeat-containing protein [Streptomyces sp. SP18CS02]
MATVLTAAAVSTPVPVATAAEEAPAIAGAPYAIEDGAYPYKSVVSEATGAELIAGDGNIVHTSCYAEHQIAVWARTVKSEGNRICFEAGNTGFLSVRIPEAYRIETVGRDVRAEISIDGKTQTLQVVKDSAQVFGEAHASDPKPAVLLDLAVTGSSAQVPGGEAADPARAFIGKLNIGSTRSCTATLVEARWVATAKSCFADDPAQSNAVAAGAPKSKTTFTVGRADLQSAGVHTAKVVELVPREDRDLVLARLEQPVFTLAPAAVAAQAPLAGEALTVAGFGRTATAWAPSSVHAAAATVGATAATGFDIVPKDPTQATVCKGDSGGPALREADGKAALVAVTSRAWQKGCLDSGEAERSGAYSVRVDDLTGWVQQVGSRRSAANEAGGSGRVRFADFDGDGKADYLTVADSGALRVHLNKGGDGHGGWQDLGQVAAGVASDRTRVRFADFDGDGRADYITLSATGAVSVYLNKGGDGRGGWSTLGQVATGVIANPDQVRFADFDGDLKTDYIVTQTTGAVEVYRNTNAAGGWSDMGRVAAGVTADRSRIRWADFDGDQRVDYTIINADGSVTVYTNHGGDTGDGWVKRAKVTGGVTSSQNLVHFTDLSADGRADYLTVNGPVSAYLNNGGDDKAQPGWVNYGQIANGA